MRIMFKGVWNEVSCVDSKKKKRKKRPKIQRKKKNKSSYHESFNSKNKNFKKHLKRFVIVQRKWILSNEKQRKTTDTIYPSAYTKIPYSV